MAGAFPTIPLTLLKPRFKKLDIRHELGRFHKANLPCLTDFTLAHTDACWEERMHDQQYYVNVDKLEEADGLYFKCPKCYHTKGDTDIGVHSILCWRPRVPTNIEPGPGRWEIVGTDFSNFSLVAGSSSVALTGGCMAHFFVKEGQVNDA